MRCKFRKFRYRGGLHIPLGAPRNYIRRIGAVRRIVQNILGVRRFQVFRGRRISEGARHYVTFGRSDFHGFQTSMDFKDIGFSDFILPGSPDLLGLSGHSGDSAISDLQRAHDIRDFRR